ncbi:MAG: AgmX/PglI C-terminal domain-containing protein [Gammaproteobacteria bacterium]|nr:AgmX/PglI C-terminal domain-containing protein [Gammaproteobacteria bacterium]
MSTITQPLAIDLALPWQVDEKQEAVFKKWLKRLGILLLLLIVIVPWLPVFELSYEKPEKEVVKTQVILKKKVMPEPEVVQQKPKPKPQPKPQPIEKPKAATAPTKSAKKPDTAPNTTTTQESVRHSAGLDSVTSELSSLKGMVNVAGIKNKKTVKHDKGIVTQAKNKVFGENMTDRTSTGIAVQDNVMRGEITQLSDHETAAVEGLVTGGTTSGTRRSGAFKAGQRDMESIRRIIESHKGSIYEYYNRALDDNPELNGRFVFSFIILPDGKISKLQLVSSELGLKSLEASILSRIQKIEFGVADASSTKVEYKFVFFPS